MRIDLLYKGTNSVLGLANTVICLNLSSKA